MAFGALGAPGALGAESEKEVAALFGLSHAGTFSTRVQALALLDKLAANGDGKLRARYLRSLYAAVSVDIAPASICDVLDKLSKVKLPARIRAYVMDCTKNFGRAKLVLRGNRHHVESSDAAALRTLLEHAGIRGARDASEDGDDEEFRAGEVAAELAANRAYLELAAELDGSDDEGAAVSYTHLTLPTKA